MAAIRNSTAACSRSFRLFAAALESGDAAHRSLVDLANLEDEYGRFRVWTGNLGAQQKGHSSLDYRLRDSPLLQSNALKLLHELELNLNEARAIVTGARLPYEQQAVREDFSDDSTSEDSEDSTDSEEERPKYELQQRMAEVIDIVNNLYRLSIRIRSPTVRTRALKAAVYRQVDPETGVDVFSQYAEYDKKHTEEVLAHLRAGRKDDDVAFLVERLSRAITRRRQQFKYWKKHREKLSSFAETADTTSGPVNDRQASQSQAAMNATGNIARTSEPLKIDLRAPASEDQPRTLLSGTEATAHHRTLDDAVDSQSVTSVATTARDLDGHGIDLPPPPDSADGERDFECPYCFVICPARYARVRSWKTHILQDLQSYVCTYKDCSLSDQMFRSRREWLEHESSSHRKVWRCPGHPDAVYSSREGLLCHLESIHNSDLGETQLQQLIRLAGTATNDLRQCCPICLVSAKDPGVAGNLHNHIANHLEKLASFALPKFAGPDEAKSGASMDASDGRRSYSEKSDATSSLWSVNTQSNRENERQDSVRPTTGLDQTADDMIARILELLDAVERSPESVVFSEEDWLKVRPGFCSFFPQPEASRVIAFLDDFFHQLGESRIDLGTLRSEIRRVLSSAFATPPPDEATNPGPVLSPGSRFPEVEQARLLAWSTYSLCKDLGSHSTSLRDDLFTIHANLSALADASDSSGSLRLDRITQAIKGTTDTLKHIKGVIEQCKPNPIDESTTQELCKKLAVWIWRIDALAANLKSSQGAEGKDLPELSADAINSLPDARTSRMEHFIQTIGQSTPESESQALGPNVMDYESAKTFAIHAIDSSADESQKEPHSPVEESNETCTVRVYNLPKTTEEREGFVNLFSALGPHLQVGPTFESRGFAVFRSREEAEHALSIFDNSKFPDVIFGFDKDGEEHAGGTVPSQSNLPIEFDVEGFLEALSRALSKPENWKHIAWAEDGRTFCVYDEEAVVPHVLPAFGLESFSLFEDRLIACGFRRQYGQQFRTNADGLKRTSVWFHKHFQRDKEEGRRSIPFLTKLQNIFSKTKESPRASLLTSQLDNAGTEIGVVSSRKPRSNFVLMAVSDIPSISDLYLSGWLQAPNAAAASAYLLAPKGSINRKISMLQHDITMLDVDAIVNGTAPGLNAGASDSISYWIHKAAGPNLLRECQSLSNCQMGQAVMTNAYDLPCRKVIHTVRPHYFQAYNSVDHNALLASCYRNCLMIAAAKGLESIAFPCLSAGGFCFPSREAAKIALRTTREFFDSGRGGSLQKIVFCVYSDVDNQVYRAVIPLYFPPTKINSGLQREVREETPGSVDEDSLVDTPDQERQDLFDMELASAGPSKQTKPTRLNESVESLSRLTGGPSLWACCKCRARPMETPNCLVCYHELCNSCEEERGSMQPPNLFLVYLRPSPDMLEDPQRIGLSSIDNREMNNEDHTRGSVRSRANSPTGKYHPTHVKAHRKHVSLDTLFYYDLPFQFDSFDQDYVIITRELSEEQSEILFEHSRRHRRNLPSLIRTRAHPNPMSDVLTIRIGSDPSFNKQDRPPGAPIYFPGPVVTADHCDFYIAGCRQWMLEINRASGSTFLNGRRLVRLPCPEDNSEEQGTTPALPPHDDRGYFIRSGDILGLGENDHGKPAYLFRIELDCVSGTEQDLWEDAEARASRYGFPTIGLEEDDEASDLEDDDDVVDPEIASGYRIVDAEQTNLAHIPEQARGAPRWTRIDRRLVNPDALKEAGLFFENRVRFMLVFKELSAGEVRRLAQRTRESRAAKAETEFTRKERRRKERRIREQKKVARQRKKGLLEEREWSRLGM